MDKLMQHWTAHSTGDFVHRITSDFVGQLEMKIEKERIEKQEVAARLGVSPGRVSQVLNNPGNLTMAKIVQYADALGMKVALIAYDDGDPDNNLGPISSEVFANCWARMGKPRDLFSLAHTNISPLHQLKSLGQPFYRPKRIPPPTDLARMINHFAASAQDLPLGGEKPIKQDQLHV